MKAIVQDRFGPPEVLRLADIDPPQIGLGDVLVRVHAAGLNPYDWHMLRGDPLIARLIAVDVAVDDFAARRFEPAAGECGERVFDPLLGHFFDGQVKEGRRGAPPCAGSVAPGASLRAGCAPLRRWSTWRRTRRRGTGLEGEPGAGLPRRVPGLGPAFPPIGRHRGRGARP